MIKSKLQNLLKRKKNHLKKKIRTKMNLRISNLNLLPKTKFLIQCQPQSSQSSQQKFLSYARKEILRNKHQSKISSQC